MSACGKLQRIHAQWPCLNYFSSVGLPSHHLCFLLDTICVSACLHSFTVTPPSLSLTHPSFVEMMYIYYCSSNWIWTRATTEIVNVKFATHKKHKTKTNAYEFIIKVGFLDVILPFLSNASNI